MATAAEIKTFVQRLGRLAVAECNRRIAAGKGFVLPSVCISQSALETGYGTSGLMTRANAFFGIKAGGSWTGKVYTAGTWEVADGEAYNTTANFRAYDTVEASVADYYDLIGNASRYSKALSYGADRSKWKTPKECITAIWAGGYATDTLYVEKNMNIINARDLTQYDALITGVSDSPLPAAGRNLSVNDLVNGKLEITDSGRTISLDSSALWHVALPLDKHFTVDSATEFTVAGVNPYKLYLTRLNGDSASVNGPYQDGDVVSVNAGDKVGFYLEIANAEIGYEMTDITVLKEASPAMEIKFSTGFPEGEETYPGTIAFFVKIE